MRGCTTGSSRNPENRTASYDLCIHSMSGLSTDGEGAFDVDALSRIDGGDDRT